MSDCPPDQVLQKFAAGQLAGREADQIGLHLQHCSDCRARVAGAVAGNGSAEDCEEALGNSTEIVAQTEPAAASNEKLKVVGGSFDFSVLDDSRRDDALGRFGPYDLLQAVGYGGMGVVFRAFEPSLNRTVAIKVLARQLASSPEARMRFHREAKAAAAINHPNVVTIHAVSEHAGLPFLVMEFVKGQSLHERIRTSAPMDVLDILRIGSQVAAGLAAAHQRGVIHRDIKPANIMLENGVERVKITDFGLARVTLEGSDVSSAGCVMGTPAYMSPEQVAGKPIDARSDLFSLGCVIHGMVAGKSPFQGSHSIEVQQKVASFAPPPLCAIAPAVPRALSDVVTRLLEKDPDRRYQTAAEVADVLTEFLSEVEQGRSAELPSPPAGSADRRDFQLRRPALWSAGVAFVVILAGLAARQGWWGSSPAVAPVPPAGSSESAVVREEPRELLRGVIPVSQAGDGRFRSIQAALERAGRGATIRILDGALYSEAIVIDDADRLAGVTLEAVGRRPRLQCAALDGPVITIKDTPNVTIRGFEIHASAGHYGIQIAGDVPGLLLSDLKCSQVPESSYPLIRLNGGASGSASAPVVITGCDLECGPQGQGVWLHAPSTVPIKHVRIAGNRLRGKSTQLLLLGTMEDIEISRNLSLGAFNGINVDFEAPQAADGIRVVNNTFLGENYWLGLVHSTLDQGTIEFRNNLILGSRQVQVSTQDLESVAERWTFRHNLWERGPLTLPDAGLDGRIGDVVESVPLVSRDPTSPDYLRPATDLARLPGDLSSDDLPYIGAKPPRAD